ncbi:MAG: hypothetical protein QM501_06400 [Gimesia sp.]
MKSTSKESKVIIWNILVIVLFLIMVFSFLYGFLFADAANAQLIAIYEVAEVGNSLSLLKEKVTKMPQTWISAFDYQEESIFLAPFKVGSTAWVLRIQAEKDKITCVKIHTEDSINYHPQTAPPDKGNCHHRW